MKYLLLSILSINTALACQLSIPESYVSTFLNPPVSGHYEKCTEEPCHCVDNVDPYISELATVFEEDELGINIEKKVLRISKEKKAAHLAKIEQDKAKEEAKKAAKAAIKTLDIDGATTIAKLKVIVKALIEAQE